MTKRNRTTPTRPTSASVDGLNQVIARLETLRDSMTVQPKMVRRPQPEPESNHEHRHLVGEIFLILSLVGVGVATLWSV